MPIFYNILIFCSRKFLLPRFCELYKTGLFLFHTALSFTFGVVTNRAFRVTLPEIFSCRRAGLRKVPAGQKQTEHGIEAERMQSWILLGGKAQCRTPQVCCRMCSRAGWCLSCAVNWATVAHQQVWLVLLGEAHFLWGAPAECKCEKSWQEGCAGVKAKKAHPPWSF